jgi:DNA-binding transcriptional MerR regulator
VKNELTVGGVASAAGVTPDAVRYYERLKLLSTAPRATSGYRVFDIGVVGRVRAIRRAQAIGMSLAEIGALFPQGRLGRAECQRVRILLAEKIAATDARIADLRHFRRELRSNLGACDRAIAGRRDAPCPVFALDSKAENRQNVGRRT